MHYPAEFRRDGKAAQQSCVSHPRRDVRAEADEMLREIAFVLRLSRSLKNDILEGISPRSVLPA